MTYFVPLSKTLGHRIEFQFCTDVREFRFWRRRIVPIAFQLLIFASRV